MQAVRVPHRWVAGEPARRCARESPRPKVPLYEGEVPYLARSRTSALVLAADAPLQHRNVATGSVADPQRSQSLGGFLKVGYRP